MPIVETAYGRVEGIERDGVLQFRGLPYAAPPVGELRWRPPEPPRPWAGVRDASRFGAGAQQLPVSLGMLPAPPDQRMDEDCLSLNVYTAGTAGSHRPVLVWIHGGGFTSGSGRDAWYNGSAFARAGAVVVTINYRLGAFGFLELDGDLRGSGGCGLRGATRVFGPGPEVEEDPMAAMRRLWDESGDA